MPTAVATKLTSIAHNSSVFADCRSCDVLVLVEEDREGESFCDWLITNPITKEFRVLPDISYEVNSRNIKYGIGYDHVSDDYKVFAFALGRSMIMHFNVYSVRNGTWRGYQVCEYEHMVTDLPKSGVTLNGRIHWINENTTNWVSAAAIFGFDIVEEKFSNVLVPSSTRGVDFIRNSRLVVLQGRLGYVKRIGESNKAQVWVMKEYGVVESWTKTTTVEVWDWFSWQLVTMLGGSEWVVKKNWSYPSKFAIYNLDGGTMKDLVFDGLPSDEYNAHYYDRELNLRGSFMETLVSPYYNCKTPLDSKPLMYKDERPVNSPRCSHGALTSKNV